MVCTRIAFSPPPPTASRTWLKSDRPPNGVIWWHSCGYWAGMHFDPLKEFQWCRWSALLCACYVYLCQCDLLWFSNTEQNRVSGVVTCLYLVWLFDNLFLALLAHLWHRFCLWPPRSHNCLHWQAIIMHCYIFQCLSPREQLTMQLFYWVNFHHLWANYPWAWEMGMLRPVSQQGKWPGKGGWVVVEEERFITLGFEMMFVSESTVKHRGLTARPDFSHPSYLANTM